jgi:hypothetical protein
MWSVGGRRATGLHVAGARAGTWDNRLVSRSRRIASFAWIAESLQAGGTIPRGNLALIRGWIDLDELAVVRDDAVGRLAIRVARIHCELPPLGRALIDRDCRTLAIRGARLEVSAAALFKLDRPRRSPLHAGRVAIDDARLELAASAVLPGLGRVVIDIAHAEAAETVFKTPLSWIFALRALEATVTLPAGITLRLGYADGELRVAGGLFGGAPVALPVALPVADLADDPAAEIAKLIALGKQVATEVVARTAEDWLRDKLRLP